MAALIHELLILQVEKLLWRGRGLARLDSGQVVMIEPGVLPGETITARVTKTAKDFLQAEAVDILTPSPLRGVHPCPHAGECGGSRFGMVSPEAGTNLKADMLRDALSRALGREHVARMPELQVVPSPKGWRYRWRGQIHVRGGLSSVYKDDSTGSMCHIGNAPHGIDCTQDIGDMADGDKAHTSFAQDG